MADNWNNRSRPDYGRDGEMNRDMNRDRNRTGNRFDEQRQGRFNADQGSDRMNFNDDDRISYGRGNFDRDIDFNRMGGGMSRGSHEISRGGQLSPDYGMRSSRHSEYDMTGGYGTYGRDSDFDSRPDMNLRSHIGKGPKGWARSDERLHDQVCEALERDPYVDASEIEVSVKDAIVTLRGSVDERRTKRLAENCAESVPGIRDVRNELHVDQSFFQRAKEALMGESDPEREESSSRSSKASKSRKSSRH